MGTGTWIVIGLCVLGMVIIYGGLLVAIVGGI